MQTIKIPVNIMAIAFFLSFLEGMLGLGFSDDLYTVIGFVELFCLGWILKIVYSKPKNVQQTN